MGTMVEVLVTRFSELKAIGAQLIGFGCLGVLVTDMPSKRRLP